ncbi:FAD/NADP-binding domain-containing protein [Dacryopinax primogenitus]|uniref:FAD/NADP-binding domain-containing protein n=1 Tax=Dacryopinax primogenitus (strain DJM 731) TaxID=1858805 RepID=M5G2H8_DACPD|nr:FAD/NADP-binding domain-containing protein [Dacryopinax primogenitus]EJU02894.1 FAD/NADP-binding domain-containing protein [Dacryopinax primogenitus]
MSKSVIIIGCGIAGPVLAMLLKHKGFEPHIFERLPEIQVAGISLGVSPQTLKVLNILGLAEKLIALGESLDHFRTYSQLRGEQLGTSDIPARVRDWLGWPMLMIARVRYCQFLYDSAKERGISITFSRNLVGVKQEGERVRAIFEDGSEAEGDLLVGCDGLHSAVRNALFGKDEIKYSRLAQIGGISITPEILKSPVHMAHQYLGDGVHFVATPIGHEQMAWVATFPEPNEAREDWKRISIENAKELLDGLPVANWDNGPKDVLAHATFVTKYGLYERPICPSWHKGRIVLLGDAAHPTSPFLGQGGNQAMEDCYHFVRLLCKAAPFTDESLESAFKEYENIRIPIVTKSVARAKVEGQKRVLSGKEACLQRDEIMLKGNGMDPQRVQWQNDLIQGPFMGESEI